VRKQTRRLNKFPNVTKLESNKAEIQPRVHNPKAQAFIYYISPPNSQAAKTEA
jgi:hypothetical protein